MPQEIRKMRFEGVYYGWSESRLTPNIPENIFPRDILGPDISDRY